MKNKKSVNEKIEKEENKDKSIKMSIITIVLILSLIIVFFIISVKVGKIGYNEGSSKDRIESIKITNFYIERDLLEQINIFKHNKDELIVPGNSRKLYIFSRKYNKGKFRI